MLWRGNGACTRLWGADLVCRTVRGVQRYNRCQPLGEDKWYLSRGTIVTHHLWQGFCETTARTLAEKQGRAAMTPKIDASEAAAVVGNSQIEAHAATCREVQPRRPMWCVSTLVLASLCVERSSCGDQCGVCPPWS